MKKIIFILIGVSFILGGVIFVLYKNNYSKSDDVTDIFKEKDDGNTDNEKEDIEELKDDTNTVIVDIKGMVVNPGVYEVPSSFRVNDVIETAGGLLDGADTSKINLAKVVSDEMTIIIYSNEEIIENIKMRYVYVIALILVMMHVLVIIMKMMNLLILILLI